MSVGIPGQNVSIENTTQTSTPQQTEWSVIRATLHIHICILIMDVPQITGYPKGVGRGGLAHHPDGSDYDWSGHVNRATHVDIAQ